MEDYSNTLTLEGTCIIFAIHIQSEIHNVVALIKFLLVLRCQLYMFWTVTVHPQKLLVVLYEQTIVCGKRRAIRYIQLVQQFFLNCCTSWTYRIVRLLPCTIVCTYSI